MKIAIVFPLYRHKKFSENLKVVDEEFTLSPPIILAYIAAILERAGHNVILIDAHALKLSKEDVLRRIKLFKPDILAFRVETYHFHDTLEWIRYLKLSTGLPVIVGGINMDLYPLETMAHKEIDFGLAGEAIFTLPEFISCLENSVSYTHIPGLYWREDGQIKYNPPKSTTVDFDLYPFPARHLLPNEVYHSFVSQVKNFTIMITQTGCPYKCRFCAITAISKYRSPAYRVRSWENVVSEIEQCYYDFGIREIDIFDATFFINKQRDIKICEELIKRGIKITWTCRSRVDVVDEEILRIASKSGCRMIFWGIESGVQKVLNAVNKNIKLEQTMYAIKLAKKYGIRNLGFLMIGNPEDTVSTVQQTIKFAKQLGLDYVQICRTIAKPSTELHEELIKIEGHDYWRDYILGFVEDRRIPVPWSKLSQKLQEKLLKWAYYSFYFRPSYIIKTVLKAKSVDEILRYVKVGIRMVFHYFYTDVKSPGWVKKLAHIKLDNEKFLSTRLIVKNFNPKNVYIVIPAYKEKDNLLVLIKKLQTFYPEFKLLIVGTSDEEEFLIQLKKLFHDIEVINVDKETQGNERGKAVRLGLEYALNKGAEVIIEMDADMSHRPEDVSSLLYWINSYDIVIGSRFVDGGIHSGGMLRKLLSVLANFYLRYSLGIKGVIDCTSGFRCYRRRAVEKLKRYLTSVEGTAYLVESLYCALKLGLSVKETPVVYLKRLYGKSKLSLRTVLETIKLVYTLKRGLV